MSFKKLFQGNPLFLLVLFLTSSSPLESPLERIIASFEKHLIEFPQEKVFLHTDRPYYAAGESIWLKAYLTAGPYHEPSSLSRTIYVELIDQESEVNQYISLYSPDGFASGYMALPDSINSGTYLLRAYTNWMRNSGEEYFFHKQIKILSSQPTSEKKSPSSGWDVQFFPEGGYLVEGILSKVAVKAIGSDGLGRQVQGEILEDGVSIVKFESNRLGMGVFGLLTKPGKTYQARIANSGQEIPLPKAQESGVVLFVTNPSSSSDISIKIQTSNSSPLKSLYLIAQTRGVIGATSKVELPNHIAFVKIPKNEFPTGITQITALDEKGKPLAERLIFIDHQDQLQVSISPDKSIYGPREPVQLTIETKDKNGAPIPANLSLSVFDSNQITINPDKDNILSNLLVTSELKGHIESPGYYFNPANADRESALDLLMLTQGWRRYTIQDALDQKLPNPLYSIEKGLSIKGKLLDKNEQPVEGGSISYLSIYPIAESKSTTSGAKGQFELRDLVYFDSTNISLNGKPKSGNSKVSVFIENKYESPRNVYPVREMELKSSEAEDDFLLKIEERRKIDKAFDFELSEKELGEVEVQGKRISEIEDYLGPRIYGNGSAKVQVAGKVELENLQHPLDLVQGRVAGVQVSGNGLERAVRIQGVNSINSSIEPLIMINDVPTDLKSLHMIPVQEIESFVVWKGPDTAIFGSRGANGVIGFYTKKNLDSSTLNATTGIGSVQLRGYLIEREFYVPKYDVQDPLNSKPDKRVTLYWAPMIQTDATGKASVRFFNSDVPTTIRGEIEGLSLNGIPGNSSFHYQIEKK